MRRAWLNLRFTLPERIQVFSRGLKRHGFTPMAGLPDRPADGDVLITWNRIGAGDTWAQRFEQNGWPVVVAENAVWGNDFNGGRWYSLARNHHNTAGRFEECGPGRWDGLQVALEPMRLCGDTVILPQRGIGSPPTAMPRGWADQALQRYGGRIRFHPGRHPPQVALRDDLRSVLRVVTWGSGAAVLASMWGCEVVSEMPGWIGAHDNTEAGRLAAFRRLAWAQWRLSEIESGEAFARLL